MARTLLAQQRKDGGWGQHATMESDAYAMGQALVALHQASGLPVTHQAYQRGVSYLLAKQAADGSWLDVTRTFPIQRYFESGFPLRPQSMDLSRRFKLGDDGADADDCPTEIC